jgi:hypothetical protein
MKIPNKVPICGRMYKIRTNSKTFEGSFSEADQCITVGTAFPPDIPEILLHEIVEATCAIRNIRYVAERGEPDNGDYRFMFNHDEFENMIKDVTESMKYLGWCK